MTTLLLAADAPRSSTCASSIRAPEFNTDAARIAWIVDEYNRRKGGVTGRAMLVRDLATHAFRVKVVELNSRARGAELIEVRHKIICITRLLVDTSTSTRKIGALFGRDHSTIVFAVKKYRAEIEPLLAAAKAGAQ